MWRLGFVVINTSDIRDLQGEKPGKAGADTDCDNTADDKQERDYVVMVPGFSPAGGFSGRLFGWCFFSGCHEMECIKVLLRFTDAVEADILYIFIFSKS